MTITAYRIVKTKYAAMIWSGIGSRDHGGRWNSKGVAIVYAAESRSLAALEQLAQLIKPRVLKDFVVASIAFDDSQTARVRMASLPAGWNDSVASISLRHYGDDWVAADQYPVLAIPSAVVAGEWNYLINPAHPEFGALAKSDPEPFVYDQRLG